MFKTITLLCAILLLILVGAHSACSQPDTLWTQLYPIDNVVECAASIRQTNDGGFIIAGWYEHHDSTGITESIFLRKIDALGNEQWYRSYRGDNPNAHYIRCSDGIITSDGGYLMVGKYSSPTTPYGSAYIIKTDSIGDILWTRTYIQHNIMNAMSVIETEDEGYILSGDYRYNGLNISISIYSMKLDIEGDILWEKFYLREDIRVSRVSKICSSNIGGYALIGDAYISGIISDPTSIYVIKIDNQGDTLWTKTFGHPDGPTEGTAIDAISDGGFYIGGRVSGHVEGRDLLIRIDANGGILWTRTFTFFYTLCTPSAIFSLPDDGCLVSMTPCCPERAMLMRLNCFGDTLWTCSFGAINVDYMGVKICSTSDGGFGFMCSMSPYDDYIYNTYLVRLAPDSSTIDPHNIPGVFTLEQNYPNPFNSSTTIPFSLHSSNNVKLALYDLLGRDVSDHLESHRQRYTAGTYVIRFDAMDLPTGIYFIRMEAGGNMQTKKMMLLR
jgi:hypothetical protein